VEEGGEEREQRTLTEPARPELHPRPVDGWTSFSARREGVAVEPLPPTPDLSPLPRFSWCGALRW
ncbi:MAG: hypothetical protein V3S55_10850, partial [Nitrospiraceae bacterium]